MATTVIGIDCATKPGNVGLARGLFHEGEAHVEQACVGSTKASVVEVIVDWMALNPSTLIALDAPLGWPTGLPQALRSHEAGAPIQVEPNIMFRRLTDRVVKCEVGKQPLDVGADRIARTAHAALTLLQELRERTGEAIPLAWKPLTAPHTYTIEVYPAATLTVYGIQAAGYKGKDGHVVRQAMLTLVQEHIALPYDTSLLERNDDALDAVICVLAGVDFLRGEVIEPTDIETAEKEGWIWVRRPSQ